MSEHILQSNTDLLAVSIDTYEGISPIVVDNTNHTISADPAALPIVDAGQNVKVDKTGNIYTVGTDSNSTTNGTRCIGLGNENSVSGTDNTVMGQNNTVNGTNVFVAGKNNTVSGNKENIAVIGRNNTVAENGSICIGQNLTGDSYSVKIGTKNDTYTIFDNVGQAIYKYGEQRYGNNYPIPLDITMANNTYVTFYEAPEDYYGEIPLVIKYYYNTTNDVCYIRAYATENCVGKYRIDYGTWNSMAAEGSPTLITTTNPTTQNAIYQLDMFYWDPAEILLDWAQPGTIGRIRFTFFFYKFSNNQKHMVVWKDIDFDPFDFKG